MPSLHWIGKEKIINHHADVPFRTLKHTYGFDNGQQYPNETHSGNKIIHGDNLEALKSLLPEYEGKIKCIYIDPPYNTGNENWVYNDNVNDPKILKWLGQVVGKESEDLSRHDKWLCMMYPRLKLLHKLLSDDGAIFISIDDNELYNLKLVCDEIFGANNYYTQIIVQSNVRGHTYRQIAKTHENILVYTKSDQTEFNEIPKDPENSDLNLQDNISKFNIRELRNRNPKFGRFNRPNLFYPFYVCSDIVDKNGHFPVSLQQSEKYNIEVFPKNSSNIDSCWRWGSLLADKNISEDTLSSNLIAKPVRTGGFNIYEKYRKDTVKAKSILFNTSFITERGTVEIGELGLSIFEFPKPLSLISLVILLSSSDDDIILDSFAGSGTTAHAVLNLNEQDGGNRKFILIEMEDYADTITAERVKRVINGYADKQPINGSFDFYELDMPLFNEDGNLNEAIEVEKIRQYVFYTETKQGIAIHTHNDNRYFLGKHNDTAYYFYYEKDKITTLDFNFLASIKVKAGLYIIYADNCLLSKDFLSKNHLIFKKIPRDITKF